MLHTRRDTGTLLVTFRAFTRGNEAFMDRGGQLWFFFNVGGFEKSSKLNFRGKIYTEMMENRC